MEKSHNYLIATGNLILLAGMCVLWIDKLELILEELVWFVELVKILGIVFLSAAIVRLLLNYLIKKRQYSPKTVFRAWILLTLALSSPLSVFYSDKILNVILNRSVRIELSSKIKPVMPNGCEAGNLSIEEYRQIGESHKLPKISTKARNITYHYYYDGFLGDFERTVTYEVPIYTKIGKIHIERKEYLKSQTVEIRGRVKKITYTETSW